MGRGRSSGPSLPWTGWACRRSRALRAFSAHPEDRHSREGGPRFTSAKPNIQRLQRNPSSPSSREGGNPKTSAPSFPSVIPAKAGIQRLQRHPSSPSFPRRRESRDFSPISPDRHSREGGNPETSAPSLQTVIPAKAGIQRLQALSHERPWMFGSAEVKRSPRSRE
ncbi:hypothetical protein [Lysobacter gummosus]|uniref:hypothetical protein n=1 Tax=Lysobacter gummosus TaxID=262324 RepID=UPI003640A043